MRALLVIGLVLALSAPAQAGVWKDADVATAIRVADAHWPGSPCQGREIIQWMTSADLGPGTLGDALNGTCTVRIAWDEVENTQGPDLSAAYLCSVIEHEFGHLAGYWDPVGVPEPDGTIDHSHSPDRHNVMFPSSPVSRDCRSALPFTARRQRYIRARVLLRQREFSRH